jgi:hypothetical protein
MVKTTHSWRYRPDYRLGASFDSKSQNAAATRGIRYHQHVYKKLNAAELDGKLLVEPWFEQIDGKIKRTMRQPDAVLLLPDDCAVVIEVKMNWADGKDTKLLTEYLPIVKTAFELDTLWPLVITGNVRGYPHPPLLGLQQFYNCFQWEPGRPTPLMLLP